MSLERQVIEAAIKASGGAEQPAEHVESLLAKLHYLEKIGRYGQLLKGIAKSNDKSNFLALLLEVTFAYQFELAGFPLDYEAKQIAEQTSSIDFKMTLPSGEAVYFELRLLQQDRKTAEDIAKQLAASTVYQVMKDGADEQAEIFRAQSTLLSKVESGGKPIKFLSIEKGTFNIVVLCVSDLLLGTVDQHDCMLATYGDSEVPKHYRREIFGLFQEPKPAYPKHIQAAAARFKHFRATVHAVLFLFRTDDDGALDYSLRQVLVWNRSLISTEAAKCVCEAVYKSVPQFA
ncbi:hypothetical protein [Variovorax atrisoli]|uniref:hypothetical protein n=1 Tax=Variovorax atrisoli TaxID=3394203 RepID=UPI000377CF0A|nr:hypothetical protein [Variovorax paradoxus]